MASACSVIESERSEDIDAMAGAIADACTPSTCTRSEALYGRWTVVQLPHMVLQKGARTNPIARRFFARRPHLGFIVAAVGFDAPVGCPTVIPTS